MRAPRSFHITYKAWDKLRLKETLEKYESPNVITLDTNFQDINYKNTLTFTYFQKHLFRITK